MKKIADYFFSLHALFILLFLMAACHPEEEKITPTLPEEPEHHYLASYEYLQTLTKDQITLLASFSEFKNFSDRLKYGIDLYKVSYFTSYQGQEIQASGLLALPNGLEKKAPLLAGLHGTIIESDQAPSNFKDINDISGLGIFASLGFITVIPDYIGFGDSEDIFHPYYDYQYTGWAVADMLLATRELLNELDVPYLDDLFITGYSEGGYASVATLKYLEETNTDFNIKATAAGAGGYDLKQIMETILDSNYYESPAYLVYILYAYNISNNWNRPLADFFREPYASQILTFADKNITLDAINDILPKNPEDLFTPGFLNGLEDGTESQFIEALEENSVSHWAPSSFLRLYHEEDDEIVPIANSEATYETMVALGAEHTAFFPYDDATSHTTGFLPMYKMAIPWFISLVE